MKKKINTLPENEDEKNEEREKDGHVVHRAQHNE